MKSGLFPLQNKVKIAVIGPGAIGCLLGAYLSKNNQVWMLDHNPDRAVLLNQQGLILEKNNSSRNCLIKATDDPKLIGPVELVLLCVKSGKVEEALQAAKPLLNQNSLLLTFQNGIGHLPLIPAILGDITWGLGITSNGATLTNPGHIQHKGQGLTRIGLPPELSSKDDKSRKKLLMASEILTAAGIETELVSDIINHVWAKLLVNVGINALTAIHDCANGSLLESEKIRKTMKEAVLEGKRVAEKIGITLADDPIQVTKEVCLATATNISSMLQDVRAKRPTEIDAINGALIQKASELGIPTPINEKLVWKVREIERNYHDFT